MASASAHAKSTLQSTLPGIEDEWSWVEFLMVFRSLKGVPIKYPLVARVPIRGSTFCGFGL